MATKAKETVYIDVDDEITTIIDKLKASDSKIVALVLPKRATVLQSVVNMKLLKRAGTSAKKSVVLITSEKGLLPLAGVAGLHVAKSLQSKPVIPPMPSHPGEESDEHELVEDDEPVIDKAAPIGALAAAAAAKDDDDTETIELDNMAMDMPASGAGAMMAAKAKKLKHLKVPNFERFRLGIVLGALGLVLLVVGWYLAVVVMPKAQVTIRTNTTSAVSSFDFTASTAQESLDLEEKRIPAVQKTVTKSDSVKVPATGERDEGTKAEGEVTITANCTLSAITVPKGTTVTTADKSYITQDTVKVDNLAGGTPGNFTCNKTVDVLAAQNGDAYNIGSGQTFTVSGFSGASGKNGSAFSGGTSKIVKFISQKDIDDAAATIRTQQDEQATSELKILLETEELYALTETRKAAEPKITPTPARDTEATEVTVAVETVYIMLGIKRDDLSQLIKKDVEGEESLKGQEVTDDGINTSIMRLNNQPSNEEASISFRTSVTAGPEIDEAFIKESIKGKKRGEAEAFISAQPGVEEAFVNYSPFWVYSTPKATKKITVVVEKIGDQQPTDDATTNE